jgi:hypothetical protein
MSRSGASGCADICGADTVVRISFETLARSDHSGEELARPCFALPVRLWTGRTRWYLSECSPPIR